MVDDVFGELFLDDEAGQPDSSAPLVPPVTVPAPSGAPAVPAPIEATANGAGPVEAPNSAQASASEVPSPAPVTAAVAPQETVPVAVPAPTPALSAPAPAAPREESRSVRERGLADALNGLMQENHDVEAAALVSLDGFTMASALPENMQEDRVGAMSAAILGLGERAAAELGRGKLSQVFIEGEHGYVLLMAAGERAVLTCLADHRAKLGLVIFDMRRAAGAIGELLG